MFREKVSLFAGQTIKLFSRGISAYGMVFTSQFVMEKMKYHSGQKVFF